MFSQAGKQKALALIKPASSLSDLHNGGALNCPVVFHVNVTFKIFTRATGLECLRFAVVGTSGSGGLCLHAARWGGCRESPCPPELCFSRRFFIMLVNYRLLVWEGHTYSRRCIWPKR